MTKKEIITEYYQIMEQASKELEPRLSKLVLEKRITWGAYFYIHNHREWYGTKMIDSILTKAAFANNFMAIVKRTSSSDWNYYLNHIKESYQIAEDFAQQQESLPFEETQKQILGE